MIGHTSTNDIVFSRTRADPVESANRRYSRRYCFRFGPPTGHSSSRAAAKLADLMTDRTRPRHRPARPRVGYRANTDNRPAIMLLLPPSGHRYHPSAPLCPGSPSARPLRTTARVLAWSQSSRGLRTSRSHETLHATLDPTGQSCRGLIFPRSLARGNSAALPQNLDMKNSGVQEKSFVDAGYPAPPSPDRHSDSRQHLRPSTCHCHAVAGAARNLDERGALASSSKLDGLRLLLT